MGEVYLVKDSFTDDVVALKLIRADRTERVRALRRFTREVRAMARLNHPSIARVFDYGIHLDEEGVRRPFFVMEYIPGESLREYLKGNPPLDLTLKLFDQMLSALAYAHARGVIHRDLKPENILISRLPSGERRLKLLDFGIARMLNDDIIDEGELEALEMIIEEPMDTFSQQVFDEMSTLVFVPGEQRNAQIQGDDDEIFSSEDWGTLSDGSESESDGSGRLTQVNQCVGTPAYLAPEQIRPRRYSVGPPSDLYAIGVMLFEYICGRRPYKASSPKELLKMHLQAPIPRARPRRGLKVPRSVVKLIRRLMSKRPTRRYLFAADVRQQLRSLPASQGVIPRVLPDVDFIVAGEEEFSPERLGLGLLKFREPPLVGRNALQRAFWGQFKACIQENKLHIILLDGESGIGKTRLARWLGERMCELGLGHYLIAPYTHRGAVGGLRMALERHLGSHGLERQHLRSRLAEEVDRIQLDKTWMVDALLSFMRPTQEEGSQEQAGQAPSNSFAVLEHFLRNLSRHRPTVLHLEDIQSAPGDEALELIRYLLNEAPEDYPLLVIATLSSESLMSNTSLQERSLQLAQHPKVSRCSLGPIERRDMMKMINALIPLEPSLQEIIVDHSGGHPLFAIQLINHWVEGGWLEPVPGEKYLTRRGRQAVPSRVNEIVERRILGFLERLEPAILGQGPLVRAGRRILESMAMLGEVVSITLLKAQLQVDKATALPFFETFFDAAFIDGLCYEELASHETEGELRFEHQMIRTLLIDWARSQPDYSRRQAICAQIKETLHTPEDTAQRHFEISEHFNEAGMLSERWRHLILGAHAALATHRHRVALELLRSASKMLSSPASSNPSSSSPLHISPSECFSACRHLLDLHLRFSQLDEAEEVLKILKKLSEPKNDLQQGWVHFFGALLTDQRGQVEDALDGFHSALIHFRRIKYPKGMALALRGKGFAQIRRGQTQQALTLLDEAVHLARQTNSQQLLAETLCRHSLVEFDMGGSAESCRQKLEEALGIHTHLSNIRGQAEAYRNLGHLYFRLAKQQEARQHYAAAHSAYEVCGDRRGAAHSLNCIGEVLRAEGDLPQAEVVYFQSLELIEGLGDKEAEAMFRANLGLVQFRRHHLDDARTTLTSSIRDFQVLGSRAFEAVLLAALICTEIEGGRISRSHQWVRRLEDLGLSSPPVDRDFTDALSRAIEAALQAKEHPLAKSLFNLIVPSLKHQNDEVRLLALRSMLANNKSVS